ncbi:hypothetical protein D3C84_1002880 [compost metagenome]
MDVPVCVSVICGSNKIAAAVVLNDRDLHNPFSLHSQVRLNEYHFVLLDHIDKSLLAKEYRVRQMVADIRICPERLMLQPFSTGISYLLCFHMLGISSVA